MLIRIALKNNRSLSISFGRNLPWSQSIYFIDIIIEDWHNNEVIFAKYIKGFWKVKNEHS